MTLLKINCQINHKKDYIITMNVPIDGYKFALQQPDGDIFTLAIASEKKTKKFLAWAICEYIPEPDPAATLETRVNHVKIWLIYCREKHRREGLASRVIAMLQESHKIIETNAETVSGAGAQLCLKNGFKFIKAIHKNKEDVYIWTKTQEKSE